MARQVAAVLRWATCSNQRRTAGTCDRWSWPGPRRSCPWGSFSPPRGANVEPLLRWRNDEGLFLTWLENPTPFGWPNDVDAVGYMEYAVIDWFEAGLRKH